MNHLPSFSPRQGDANGVDGTSHRECTTQLGTLAPIDPILSASDTSTIMCIWTVRILLQH